MSADLQDQSGIAKCVQGADAVISALRPNSLKVQGDKPVMHGLAHIIAAMKHAGVRRLIQISTAAYRDPKDGFAFKAHAFVALFKVIAQGLRRHQRDRRSVLLRRMKTTAKHLVAMPPRFDIIYIVQVLEAPNPGCL